MKKKDEKIVKDVVKVVAIATGHPEVPPAIELTEAALKGAKTRNIIVPPTKKLRYRVKKPSSTEDLKLRMISSNRPRHPRAGNYRRRRGRRRNGLGKKLLEGY